MELHSVCSPALGGCVTKYTEYSSHTYDGSTITAEGEDQGYKYQIPRPGRIDLRLS